MWATSTHIRSGSILGPSCLTLEHPHFKMNAITGEIIEFNIEQEGKILRRLALKNEIPCMLHRREKPRQPAVSG